MAGDEEWTPHEYHHELNRLLVLHDHDGGWPAVTRYVLGERAVLLRRAELAEKLLGWNDQDRGAGYLVVFAAGWALGLLAGWLL